MATGSRPPDGSVLQEWCRSTWTDLYHFVYHRVQNRETAEDLTQESYLRALARKPVTPLPSGAYLRTIALNLIRDRWRRQRRHGTLSTLEESWLSAQDPAEGILDRMWLEDLMRKLPEEHRDVLRLRLVEGLSRAETARRMGRSQASIRGLQYRALRALRERVREHSQEVTGR